MQSPLASPRSVSSRNIVRDSAPSLSRQKSSSAVDASPLRPSQAVPSSAVGSPSESCCPSLTFVVTYLSWVWISNLLVSFTLRFLSDLYFFSLPGSSWGAQFFVVVLFSFFFSPLLLMNRKFLVFTVSFPWIYVLLSFLGILACAIPRMPPLLRMFLFGLTFSLLFIVFYAGWISSSLILRGIRMWSLLSGFLLHLVIRYSSFSLDPLLSTPILAFVTSMITIISAFILWVVGPEDRVSLSKLTREANLFRNENQPLMQSVSYYLSIPQDDERDISFRSSPGGREHSRSTPLLQFSIGSCFGAAVFVLFLLLSGYSTIPRWAGLEPFPLAIVIFVCLSFGSFVGASKSMHSPLSWLVAIVGVGFLCFGSPQLSFFGGCVLTVVLPAFLFASLNAYVDKFRGIFLFSSTLSFTFLSVLALFAVNARFSNSLFYGRPWIPLIFAVMFFGPSYGSALTWHNIIRFDSLFSVFPQPSVQAFKKSGDVIRTLFVFPPIIVLVFLFLLAGVGHLPSTMTRAFGKVEKPRSHALIPLKPPVGIVIGSETAAIQTLPMQPAQNCSDACSNSTIIHDGDGDDDLPPRPFTVLELNLKQGFGSDGLCNLAALVDLVEEQDHRPSFIGLQEIETNHMWTGSYDAMEYLSYKLHMNTVYGSNPKDTRLGVGILSKLEIDRYDTNCSDRKRFPRGSCASARVEVVSHKSLAPLEIFVTMFQGKEEQVKLSQSDSMNDLVNAISTDTAVLWLGEVQFSSRTKLPSKLTASMNYFFCESGDSSNNLSYQFFRGLNVTRPSCDSTDSFKMPIISTFIPSLPEVPVVSEFLTPP